MKLKKYEEEPVEEQRSVGWVHGFYGNTPDPLLYNSKVYLDAYLEGRNCGHEMAKPWSGA